MLTSRRIYPIVVAMLAAPCVALAAQRSAAHATVVYAVGKDPTMPIPVLTSNEQANEDVADQMFLHLVTFSPGGRISGDNAMLPSLAKSWRRIDPLTLVFELDARARWQDGAPVTPHDVVYTWELANNPAVARDQSRLEPIASVEPAGDRAVRVRFKRAFAEQVYTFGFLMQPLPSHLLERTAPQAIAASEFARHPVGDGPFRFERRVPGQLIELHADSNFFLGRPTIARVIFRVVEDPNTRLTYFLSGETDIFDNITPAAIEQVRSRPDARLVDVPSGDLVYLLFNTRSRADTTRPHPLFADPRVREALTLALDRQTIATATFGPGTPVPDAAQSQLWKWITPSGITSTSGDVARARALLAQAGWRDANGDGVLDRNGTSLRFTLVYSSASTFRHTIALMVQQMWRNVGAQVDLERVEPAVYRPQIEASHWDIFVQRVGEDPTPSSLVQSWSCEAAQRPGSTNYARWCDSTFDQMVTAATLARDQAGAWRKVLARMTAMHPAIFLAAPGNQVAVHRRFDNVVIWPSHAWLSLWQWRVRPGAALARDQ